MAFIFLAALMWIAFLSPEATDRYIKRSVERFFEKKKKDEAELDAIAAKMRKRLGYD